MLRALNAQREPWMERVRSLGTAGILLTPCEAPPPDVADEYHKLETQYQMPGARITCFTSTKVQILQILTPEALRARTFHRKGAWAWWSWRCRRGDRLRYSVCSLY